MTLRLMGKNTYKISAENNDCCHIAGIFFPTAPALIVYFEVTWHLTMKLFAAKNCEQATLQNLWRQRVIEHCYPRMLTARKIYFHKFEHEKMFSFVRYISNHLKTGPSSNS